jgi:nuclear pore complex protein Nup155
LLTVFKGAIELPLRCATAWDPDGIGLEWRPPARSIHDQNASPTGTIATLKPEGAGGPSEHAVAMRQAWETRMRCYDIALGSFNSFNETEGVTTDADLTAATALRNDAWNAVFSSTDAAFHSRLYDWCMERGLTDIILNVSICLNLASSTHRDQRFKLHSSRNTSARHLSLVNVSNYCGNIM